MVMVGRVGKQNRGSSAARLAVLLVLAQHHGVPRLCRMRWLNGGERTGLRVIWPVVLDLVNPLSVSEGCFFFCSRH